MNQPSPGYRCEATAPDASPVPGGRGDSECTETGRRHSGPGPPPPGVGFAPGGPVDGGGAGEAALALPVAAVVPVDGELGRAGRVAVDLDDVDLRRPRLVVRFPPECTTRSGAAGGADPGLPVAVLLGERVLRVDAPDGVR